MPQSLQEQLSRPPCPWTSSYLQEKVSQTEGVVEALRLRERLVADLESNCAVRFVKSERLIQLQGHKSLEQAVLL